MFTLGDVHIYWGYQIIGFTVVVVVIVIDKGLCVIVAANI